MEKQKQTILIDASPIVTPLRYRGIGNHVYSFLKQLEKNQEYHCQILIPGTKTQFAKGMGLKSIDLIPADWEFIQLPKPGKLEKILPELYYGLVYQNIVKRAKPDLYVNLSGNNYAPTGVKTVNLIYDLIPYRTNSFSQKSFLANFLKARQYKWLLERGKLADKIITISDFSKRDLVDLGIEEGKIATIPLAVPTAMVEAVTRVGTDIDTDQHLKRKVLNIYNITEPYICYFGGLEKNKNVPTVLNAFALIAEKFPSLRLVIGGAEFKLGWDHKPIPLNERALAVFEQAKELKIAHRVIYTGFVTVDHLPVIYKNAQCFIHLSKYEGFGLNVLEAQYIGTPVVAADASTYPEILQDSALLVNPENAVEVAAALESLLNNNNEGRLTREKLIAAGHKNITRFSWEKNYQDTIACFAALLKEQKYSQDETPNLLVNSNIDQAINPSEKPKVAVVLAAYFYPFVGGMEQVALDYAKFLAQAGYKVYILTSDRKNGKVVIKKDEEYQGLNIIRLKRTGKNYYFFGLKDLGKTLRTLKPDLIQLNSFGMFAFERAIFNYKFFRLRNRSKKITVIASPHGPFMSKVENGFRAVFKTIYNQILGIFLPRIINFVIADNQEQPKWIKGIYHFNDKNIWFFPPVVEKAELSQPELAKIKSGKKYIQITAISRLNQYKGFPDIIAAFTELNSAVATKLFIGGADDDETQHIKDLCLYSTRKEDITFQINLSEADKKKILRETDIFILAGEWEAFGIVLVEAMREGAAIISTNTEGGRYLVSVGNNGYLFEYGNFRSLLDILNKLILDKAKLKQLQSEAYLNSQKFFSEKVAADYIAMIKKYT